MEPGAGPEHNQVCPKKSGEEYRGGKEKEAEGKEEEQSGGKREEVGIFQKTE